MVRAVVDHGVSKAAAARRFNTSPKTDREVHFVALTESGKEVKVL